MSAAGAPTARDWFLSWRIRITRSTIKTVKSSTGTPARTDEVKECRDKYRCTDPSLMSRTTRAAVITITIRAPDQAR